MGHRLKSQTARAALYGLGATVAFLLVYVAIWRIAPSGTYFLLILATYGLIAAVALFQLVGVAVWRERLQVVGLLLLLVGLVVMIFAGLRPRTACFEPYESCREGGLTPQPWLVVGVLLTASGIALDLRATYLSGSRAS